MDRNNNANQTNNWMWQIKILLNGPIKIIIYYLLIIILLSEMQNTINHCINLIVPMKSNLISIHHLMKGQHHPNTEQSIKHERKQAKIWFSEYCEMLHRRRDSMMQSNFNYNNHNRNKQIEAKREKTIQWT